MLKKVFKDLLRPTNVAIFQWKFPFFNTRPCSFDYIFKPHLVHDSRQSLLILRI